MTVADEELIAGYFRPITKFAAIKDRTRPQVLAVFNDRPQAGVSRIPGSLEFIYERKTVSSDWRGVAEVTNDDYDGFYGYSLFFLETDTLDDVRKIQVEEDLEVLHLIGASAITNLTANDTAKEVELPQGRSSECIITDVIPIQRLSSIYFTVQLTLTNVCSTRVSDTTLGELLSVYGFSPSNIRAVEFKSADGILNKKEGGKVKQSLR